METSTLPSSLNEFSLLPDNRSHLERGLELSFSQHIYGVMPPLPGLLDGQQTPVDALPFLALERQVSEWREDYTDDIKRQVTASSWPVKRQSGTRSGIKRALSTLNFACRVTPWHQQTPKGEPYHLDVLAWSQNNAPINLEDAQRLEGYLNEVKSERDVINLALTFGVESSLGLAAAIAPAVNVHHLEQTAILPPPVETPMTLGLTMAPAPMTTINHLTLKATL